MFWQNTEEFLRLGRRFEVEVVLSNDGLGVSGLESSLAHRAVFSDVHRNKGVPEHVVSEAELGENTAAGIRDVDRHDGKLFQRVGPEPGRQIGMNRNEAFHANLRNLRLNVDRARIEAHRLSF